MLVSLAQCVILAALLLCARRSLSLYEAFPHQYAGVHNATLEALRTALAAGIGRANVLAHLLNDSQELLVFGHPVGAAGGGWRGGEASCRRAEQ